jgi:2C-methyl-D-erythritol 2,4-cyclodiphosphate synthase
VTAKVGHLTKNIKTDKRRFLKMERYAWRGRVKGDIAEYKRRHDEIWPEMKKVLAGIMGVDEDDVSIKATTTEKLGYTGREEGISAYAVVLIEKP